MYRQSTYYRSFVIVICETQLTEQSCPELLDDALIENVLLTLMCPPFFSEGSEACKCFCGHQCKSYDNLNSRNNLPTFMSAYLSDMGIGMHVKNKCVSKFLPW